MRSTWRRTWQWRVWSPEVQSFLPLRSFHELLCLLSLVTIEKKQRIDTTNGHFKTSDHLDIYHLIYVQQNLSFIFYDFLWQHVWSLIFLQFIFLAGSLSSSRHIKINIKIKIKSFSLKSEEICIFCLYTLCKTGTGRYFQKCSSCLHTNHPPDV